MFREILGLYPDVLESLRDISQSVPVPPECAGDVRPPATGVREDFRDRSERFELSSR